ncbi:MAG: glycosyltransferase, partial [Bdellovibrionota bacterium]
MNQGNYNWESLGDDPYFYLESTKSDVYPDGWVEIDLEAEEAPRHPLLLVLYVNDGKGYRESTAMRLPSPKDGVIHAVLKLPPRVHGLRLDPTTRTGLMRIGKIKIRELTKIELLFRLIGPRVGPLFFRKGYLAIVIRKYWDLWKAGGIEAIRNRFMGHTPNRTAGNYVGWVKHYDVITEADRIAIRSRISDLSYRPLISIVMPVYNVEEKWLRSAIESVLGQIYPHWELCIADDASPKPHIKAVLTEYQKRDSRIKIEYRKDNGHISEASNSALALATGEFVALMDHDDELAEHALYMVA